MVLCWAEGHGSSIHDHANAHCFMKMLAGNLCEIRYEYPKNEPRDDENISPLKENSRSILRTDEVCYINGKLTVDCNVTLSRTSMGGWTITVTV